MVIWELTMPTTDQMRRIIEQVQKSRVEKSARLSEKARVRKKALELKKQVEELQWFADQSMSS
jgi:hypothetical protein